MNEAEVLRTLQIEIVRMLGEACKCHNRGAPSCTQAVNLMAIVGRRFTGDEVVSMGCIRAFIYMGALLGLSYEDSPELLAAISDAPVSMSTEDVITNNLLGVLCKIGAAESDAMTDEIIDEFVKSFGAVAQAEQIIAKARKGE